MLAVLADYGAFAHDLVPASALPDAFRALLDHGKSMTAVLTDHWRAEIVAEVACHTLAGGTAALVRRVVLMTEPARLPVEIAEIRVEPGAFDGALLRRLAGTSVPFGRSLQREGIAFATEPVAFFKVTAAGSLAEAGRVEEGTVLFGRKARLLGRDGRLLAETVEILPRA
ncbi:hypothetical protein IGS68_04465 [Skermanella sp. TT6]|uniref:Uncharacterized protein n=1 Tax=Skermanella cutis TaxID=2775420 RepID=A0ABX7BDK1_9PROT|nr:hypothetical protein [Skermanella sp. TT6]QQP90512.1 hypothetical protein IGS68_04465 [Skermanella sp. TT6]